MAVDQVRQKTHLQKGHIVLQEKNVQEPSNLLVKGQLTK